MRTTPAYAGARSQWSSPVCRCIWYDPAMMMPGGLMHQIYMFLLCLFACTRTSVGLVPDYCLRAGHHAIANEKQAVSAARDAWYCVHPDEPQSSVQTWQHGSAVTRAGANWVVTTKRSEGRAGPVIEVKLAPDGQVQDVAFSQ
jgi:hypothetical protein